MKLRPALTVTLFALLSLLLAGCRLDASISLDINEDGSGQYIIEAGLDQELRELLGQFGVSAEDLVATLQSGFPEGTSVTRDEGDLTYFVNTVDFASTTEVEETIRGATEAAGGESRFDTFVREVDEEGSRLEAKIDLADVEVPFDVSQISEDALQANFFARLPGEVTSHNADEELADGRLRWGLPITGGILDIQAESSFDTGGIPSMVLIVGAAVLLGIVGLFLIMRMGRKEEHQAIAATSAPPPPLDFTSPPADRGDDASSDGDQPANT